MWFLPGPTIALWVVLAYWQLLQKVGKSCHRAAEMTEALVVAPFFYAMFRDAPRHGRKGE
jgi:hypothetical protein